MLLFTAFVFQGHDQTETKKNQWQRAEEESNTSGSIHENPSGTILISISVDGSRIHRSLLKNIWWKRIKYFVKFVDIIAASAAIDAKNSPVPIQREEGRSVRRSAFEKTINSRAIMQTATQILRSTMAFKNSPWTSSIWAISRSLKIHGSLRPYVWLHEDLHVFPLNKPSSG